MKPTFWHQELYGLLFLCERKGVERTVLDCGAGGPRPPLAIFQEHGYKTVGIEISEGSKQSANSFEQEQNLNLNIQIGDMRSIDFPDNSFGVVYSYNTIFHMMKEDILKSIAEMVRVLKPGGLLYFNLMSTADDGLKEGVDIGHNEMKQEERGVSVIHCYHEENEIDDFLEELGVTIERKSVKNSQIPYKGSMYHTSYIDYILTK